MMRDYPGKYTSQTIIDMALMTALADRPQCFLDVLNEVRIRLAPDIPPTADVLSSRLQQLAIQGVIDAPIDGGTIALSEQGMEWLQSLALLPLAGFRHEFGHVVEALKVGCLVHLATDVQKRVLTDIMAARDRCLAVQRTRLEHHADRGEVSTIAAHKFRLAEAETVDLRHRLKSLSLDTSYPEHV